MTVVELSKKELEKEYQRKRRRIVAEDEEKRLARNAYQREWRKNHPESVKAAKSRYWEKKAWQREAAKLAQKEQEQANGTDQADL